MCCTLISLNMVPVGVVSVSSFPSCFGTYVVLAKLCFEMPFDLILCFFNTLHEYLYLSLTFYLYINMIVKSVPILSWPGDILSMCDTFFFSPLNFGYSVHSQTIKLHAHSLPAWGSWLSWQYFLPIARCFEIIIHSPPVITGLPHPLFNWVILYPCWIKVLHSPTFHTLPITNRKRPSYICNINLWFLDALRVLINVNFNPITVTFDREIWIVSSCVRSHENWTYNVILCVYVYPACVLILSTH